MSGIPRKRRWFRFSLRMLFVVVTVMCVWLGWNVRVVHERKSLRRELEAAGGQCQPRLRSIDSPVYAGTPAHRWPEWRAWLGDSPFYAVVLPAADWVEEATRVFPEAHIVLSPFKAYPPLKRPHGYRLPKGLDPAAPLPRVRFDSPQAEEKRQP